MLSSGIVIVPSGPLDDVLAAVTTAETAGLDFCLVADEGFNYDVYAMLAFILEHTQRLRVAPITNPYTRHPAVTASALATVSALAPGRVFLSVVAGGSLALEPMGLTARQPATACREMIAIVRGLLAGDKCNFNGSQFSLRDARLQIPAARLPVWVIGRGPQMLRMAGECADVAVVTSTLGLDRSVAELQAAAARTDRALQMASLGIMAFNQSIVDEMRPHSTYVLLNSPASVLRELNLSDEWVAELRRRRETGGAAAAGQMISDDLLRRSMVLGTPEECASQIRQLAGRWRFAHFIMPIMSLEQSYALPVIREAARIYQQAGQMLAEGDRSDGL
jgi:5,10-methylenetetrahydromethanopterin reductase